MGKKAKSRGGTAGSPVGRKKKGRTAKKNKAKAKAGDNVCDGKMIHIRVTLGYLKGISSKRKETNSGKGLDYGIMSAYAELEPGIYKSGYEFASSRPLRNEADRITAVWPRSRSDEENKVEAISKTKRRLYFSTLLKRDRFADDGSVISEAGSFSDSITDGYSPELVNIRLGLMRQDQKIPLGIATLVINAREAVGRRVELPVRIPTASDNFLGENATKISPRRLFGRRASKSTNSFRNSDQVYGLEPNAVLHIRLDVKGAVYSLQGPALWGDLDGDDDSFSPSIIGDSSLDGGFERGMADEHEAIEVLKDFTGTTIFASLEKPSALDVNNAVTPDSPLDAVSFGEVLVPKSDSDQSFSTDKVNDQRSSSPSREQPVFVKVSPLRESARATAPTNSTIESPAQALSTADACAESKHDGKFVSTLHKKNKSGTELDMLLVEPDDDSDLSIDSGSHEDESESSDGTSLSLSSLNMSLEEPKKDAQSPRKKFPTIYVDHVSKGVDESSLHHLMKVQVNSSNR